MIVENWLLGLEPGIFNLKTTFCEVAHRDARSLKPCDVKSRDCRARVPGSNLALPGTSGVTLRKRVNPGMLHFPGCKMGR